MTTYTWLGVSAPWTSASFWSVDGTQNGSVPGAPDAALVAAPGSYTITIGTVSVDTVNISDPSATLQVNTQFSAGIAVSSGGLVSAGTINVAAAGTLLDSGTTFDNTGTIMLAAGAEFSLTAPVTTGALGTFVNNGGTVILPSVNNTGGTLSSLALGNVVLTSVTGGVIRNDGGTLTLPIATPVQAMQAPSMASRSKEYSSPVANSSPAD